MNLYMHIFTGTMLIIGSIFLLFGVVTWTSAIFDGHTRVPLRDVWWLLVVWTFTAGVLALTVTWWLRVRVA